MVGGGREGERVDRDRKRKTGKERERERGTNRLSHRQIDRERKIEN